MRRNLKLRNYKITKLRNSLRSHPSQRHSDRLSERGYMMITLMLFVALVTIALLAVLPEMKLQIRRDREEELMHRGTAYMRAIQHYNKKLGRYPNSISDLENTNNLRFLRKHYTDPVNRDPVTGKEREFKLLHQQDISLNNGPVLGLNPGQGQGQGQGQAGSAFGQNGGSSFGQSAFGQNANGQTPGQSPFGNGLGQLGGQPGKSTNQAAGGDDSGNSSNGENGSNAGGSSSSSSSSSPNGSDAGNGSGTGLSGPTFGGGPILGVASLSNEKTVRVFFDKSHYKDWLFFYVPGMEKGGLVTGPVNPNMQNGAAGGLMPGVPGQMPGLPGQGMVPGQGQGFGGSAPGQTNFGLPNQGQTNQGQPNQGQPSPGQTPPAAPPETDQNPPPDSGQNPPQN